MNNEIIHPKKFSNIINNYFSEINLDEYSNFKFKKVRSRRDQIKELLSKYYSPSQIIGLFSIMHERVIKKGTVIKKKDQIFTFADDHSVVQQTPLILTRKTSVRIDSDDIESEVFVIESGMVGLYVYSYGEK